MSIASQLTRIQQNRNTIRNKLVELGLATGTDTLDVLAEAVAGIEDNGSVSVNVKEGETYTIPAGFHDGSGTVSGVAGGGNYSLQSKTGVIPTKQAKQITPDDGYYGLSDVTVAPIPDAYQDVTSVTAAAADVLSGKVIVSSTGQVVTGGMPNNGAVSKTLTTADASYTVPGGYHSGSGTVKIVPEDKSVTPTKSVQNITATSGKVLNKVTVAAIPDEYQVVTEVDADAADVLSGKKIVDAEGNVVTGTMPNNGAVDKELTPIDATYTVPAGYHNGSGSVTVATYETSVTPTKEQQNLGATGAFLTRVTVNAIPDAYQDVTAVTAGAADVLSGKKIVDSEGTVVTGTMNNYSGTNIVTDTLDVSKTTTTLPTGYHSGSKVSIVLEEKSATPTKSSQTIAPTSGKVLSKVTVAAIPVAYQDVTSVTATADTVLTGSSFVNSAGTKVDGKMVNNGAVNVTLDTKTASYKVPIGYHNGTGKVSISLEEKTATPTKSSQTITPASGKVLSQVTVAAIPAAYQDVTKVTATADQVLDGKVIVAADGTVVTGSMANNGDVTATIDGLTTMSVTIPAGYTTGGTVSLTSDIEEALAAI